MIELGNRDHGPPSPFSCGYCVFPNCCLRPHVNPARKAARGAALLYQRMKENREVK